jgi:hypothetical protein
MFFWRRKSDEPTEKPPEIEEPEFFRGKRKEIARLARIVKRDFEQHPEMFKQGSLYGHRHPATNRKHVEEQRLFFGFYTATRAAIFDWYPPELSIEDRARNDVLVPTYLATKYFKLARPKEGSADWEEKFKRYLDLISWYGDTRIDVRRLSDVSEWAAEARQLRELEHYLRVQD